MGDAPGTVPVTATQREAVRVGVGPVAVSGPLALRADACHT